MPTMPALRRRALPAGSLALAGVLLAACGSTVQSRTTVATSDAGSSGSSGLDGSQGPTGSNAPGLPAAGGSAPVGAASGTGVSAGPSLTGSTTQPGQAPVAVAGSGKPVAGAASATLPAKGRGWDSRFVYVGVLTVKDLHAVANSLGIALDPGDTEGQAQAVAGYVNSHGGLFGRQLKILFRDVKTASAAQNPEAEAAAACTDFTQDRPVIAVYNWISGMDTANFRACLAKAHTPMFSASSAITDTEATKGLEGFFYQTAMVTWDRLAPVFVSRLKSQGWFGGWDRVTGRPGAAAPRMGILTSSTNAGTRVAADIKNALAAAGYPGALVYQWVDASQGQTSSVNYFNQNGVDHVIVADLELTAFQTSAASQQYKPRYGITSYNDPYTNLELNSPAGANNGALGIGWAPAYDVSDANDPGATGEGQRTCLALMAKGGQSFSGKRTARLLAMAVCDSVLLAVRGATSQGGLDAASIYQGALRVSPSFSSALSFGTSALTPTHLFVPSSARDLAWFTECSCFRYTSKGTTARF